MLGFDDRVFAVWRQTIALGWPVAIQQALNTLMRTIDIVVTGLFSPATVAAVGLADLYSQIPLRVGLGLGTGAITLSSQDTGLGAALSRDRAVTQALLIGALCGLPLVGIGLLSSRALIAALGAESEVVRLGGLYLAIVFAAAPMRIVGPVGARSLQGAGDTHTPMIVNGSANALNILLTVGLGLGIWVAPALGIVGVGVATAISRTFEALVMTGAIASARTDPSLARPEGLTITRQLIAVSVPNFAEGMSTSLANFPFNALLLLFGTEVNAAYHIGRRLFQQLTGPLYRSFNTVTNIIVGQTLGEGKPDEARYSAGAILALASLRTPAPASFFWSALSSSFRFSRRTRKRSAMRSRSLGSSGFRCSSSAFSIRSPVPCAELVTLERRSTLDSSARSCSCSASRTSSESRSDTDSWECTSGSFSPTCVGLLSSAPDSSGEVGGRRLRK